MKRFNFKKFLMSKEFFVLVAAIILVTAGYFVFSNEKNPPTSGQVVKGERETVTMQTFPSYIKNVDIVKDLPKDSVVSLKFYNFNTGKRAIDAQYVISSGQARLGSADNPELEILIHSKYFSEMNDFCKAFKNAKESNDVAYWSNINSAKFLWKYRKMMKYRDCLGL